MTSEEIKKALNTCTFGYCREKRCKDCPLDSDKEPCITNLHLSALEFIRRLEAENAALRERLGKAVELPVKVGDTVYLLSQTSRCPAGEIVEAKIIDLIGREDGYRFTAGSRQEWFFFLKGDIGTWVFTTREAALARLTELKGGKE